MEKIRKEETTTVERLENSIRHQPERYDVIRTEKGLESVYDYDSGIHWVKLDERWVWYYD